MSEIPATPFWSKKKIPHYYGDDIRNLFIASAVIYAVAIPLWGNLLPFDYMTGVLLVLILVLLAGMTNPHSRILMVANAIVAGAGVFFMQSTAIAFYSTDSSILFFLREVVVILLLFAFYHSVKSARNMILGKVGATPRPGEFAKK